MTTHDFYRTFRLVTSRPLDVTRITVRSLGPLEGDASIRARALRQARSALGSAVLDVEPVALDAGQAQRVAEVFQGAR